MSTTWINTIGFVALAINLYSMSTKGEYKLRLISLIANSIYVLYGVLIKALPVIIGCLIAVFLHAYHIKRLHKKSNAND